MTETPSGPYEKEIRARIGGTEIAGTYRRMASNEEIEMIKPFPGLTAALPASLERHRQVSPIKKGRAGLALLYWKAIAYARRLHHDAFDEQPRGTVPKRSAARIREWLQQKYFARLTSLDRRQRKGTLSRDRHSDLTRRLRSRTMDALALVSRAERRARHRGFDIKLSDSDITMFSEYFGH
ncbi:MAG: hypothetical protein ACOC8L_00825 [Spirochaetota bacterium]